MDHERCQLGRLGFRAPLSGELFGCYEYDCGGEGCLASEKDSVGLADEWKVERGQSVASGWKNIVCFAMSEEYGRLILVDYELGAGLDLFDRVSEDDVLGPGSYPFYYLRHFLGCSHDYILSPIVC